LVYQTKKGFEKRTKSAQTITCYPYEEWEDREKRVGKGVVPKLSARSIFKKGKELWKRGGVKRGREWKKGFKDKRGRSERST